MNKIIALAIRLSGFGKLADVLNGYKTKLGGGGLMLAGAGTILLGASAIVQEIVACGGLDCVVGVVRGLGDSKNAKMVLEGMGMFSTGLGLIGVGHKIDKTGTP